MRIIAGKLKHKSISTLKKMDARPTTSFLKETIFNLLSDFIQDAKFLDLFSGTGNIGFEAISRGAKRAIMIEKDSKMVSNIIKNVENFNISDQCRAYKNDVLRAIEILSNKNEKFDIIFLDPPYEENLSLPTLKQISKNNILNENGIIICEHRFSEELNDIILDDFEKIDERKYGKKLLTLYGKR